MKERGREGGGGAGDESECEGRIHLLMLFATALHGSLASRDPLRGEVQRPSLKQSPRLRGSIGIP